MAPPTAEPFSLPRFEVKLRTRWLGRELQHEPVVGSTMDIARELAAAGAVHGTIVSADEQTAGRGRLGRRWLAPPGVNLSFSILLRPTIARLKALAMVAPLAVLYGVERECGLTGSIKWPNDVQINGHKLAGILIEAELLGEVPSFAIAGIGLNVNLDVAAEPEIAQLATSLLRETGRRQQREPVLAACLNAFEALYEEPLAQVVEQWRARLNTLGQQVRVSSGGREEDGIAEDVTDDGGLVLRRADGSRRILTAGEVSLRPAGG